jgi:cytochrome c peroxidase
MFRLRQMTDFGFSGAVAGVAFVLCLAAGAAYSAFSPFSAVPRQSKIELLGELIFNDTNLSEPPGLSCAKCHDPRLQGQSRNGSVHAAVAKGSRDGVFGNRNVPSILYASFIPPLAFESARGSDGKMKTIPRGGLFLDGRASSLEEQVEGPLFNSLEMNNTDRKAFARKVEQAKYATLFREVFGDGAFADSDTTVKNLAAALAAYERTPEFAPFASRFDRYLEGKLKLSDQEIRGFDLFKDREKGNCISCHAGGDSSHKPRDWLFTDFTYDALGAPRSATPFNDDPRHFDLGLCIGEGITFKVPKGFDVNSMCGAFRVPSLRNVAVTAPYFHNGSIATLREAVEFYATRDVTPERWYPSGVGGSVAKFNDLPDRYTANVNTTEAPYDRKPGQPPRLNHQEIDDIVAFLETLTDPQGEDF